MYALSLNPANFDVLVKVIEGCFVNDNFWVFATTTTDVEFTLTVTDTETSQMKEYFNPLGQPAEPITDTSAFATCPWSGEAFGKISLKSPRLGKYHHYSHPRLHWQRVRLKEPGPLSRLVPLGGSSAGRACLKASESYPSILVFPGCQFGKAVLVCLRQGDALARRDGGDLLPGGFGDFNALAAALGQGALFRFPWQEYFLEALHRLTRLHPAD